MFNFRCVVVDTLFQFGTIHQNLIVYLFIHGLFYEDHIIVKQHTLGNIIIYFEKLFILNINC